MPSTPSLHPLGAGSPSSRTPLFTGLPRQRDLAPRPRRGKVTRCACHPCRRKKTKCDGARPICGACLNAGNKRCEYSVPEGPASLIDDLKRACAEAESEKHALRELVDYLCLGPEKSAWEVVQQLRAAGSGADPRRILEGVVRDVRSRAPPVPAPIPVPGGQEMHAIETDALAGSVIRVPARPWTSVAGDGIVSSLISAFFKWDEPFAYCYVVRDLFVRDMRYGVPSQAKYCSPLLVNALCAIRSFSSESVKQLQRASGIDLRAKFFDEAKRHLDAELLKPSLTTTQGLYTLYIYTFSEGTNRAGAMYRFAAYEMLQRMKPGRLIAKLDPSVHREAEQRQALIRTSWGLYVFECFLSNTYQTPPVMSPPAIPKPLDCSEPSIGNIDINGHPYGLLSPGPPLVPGILEVLCEAALLHHKVMVYNSKVRPIRAGSAVDMDGRREFFSELATLEDSLHPRMRYCINPAPQTLYLKLYISVIAYNLLRPLPTATRIPYSLHSSGFTTVSSLIIQLCTADVHIIESYARTWGLAEYSPMFFAGIWNVTTSLIPVLPDNDNDRFTSAPDPGEVSELFTRACALVSVLERDYPIVWPVMQGVLALACKTGKVIPVGARRYFEGTGWTQQARRWDNLRDLPITFALPVQDRLLLGEGGDGNWGVEGEEGTGIVGCDLAALLEDWAGLDG